MEVDFQSVSRQEGVMRSGVLKATEKYLNDVSALRPVSLEVFLLIQSVSGKNGSLPELLFECLYFLTASQFQKFCTEQKLYFRKTLLDIFLLSLCGLYGRENSLFFEEICCKCK